MSVAAMSQAAPPPPPITISANVTDPVTVGGSGASQGAGTLELTGGDFRLERDYGQSVQLGVTNQSDSAVVFYLDCVNPYDDIALGFVGSGSEEQPMVVQAGETQQVELSVFTQNAEAARYSLRINAHPVGGNNPVIASTTVELIVDTIQLNVRLELNSLDDSTMARTYTLTNDGDYVSDIKVEPGPEAANYVSFDPGVSNYAMDHGDSVVFTVRPDLGKMNREKHYSISDYLRVRGGGQSQTFPYQVDVSGELKSIPMGALGVLQAGGNPLSDLSYGTDEACSGTGIYGPDEISYDISCKLPYGHTQELPITVKFSVTPFYGDPTGFKPKSDLSIDGNEMIQLFGEALMDSREFETQYDKSVQQFIVTVQAAMDGKIEGFKHGRNLPSDTIDEMNRMNAEAAQWGRDLWEQWGDWVKVTVDIGINAAGEGLFGKEAKGVLGWLGDVLQAKSIIDTVDKAQTAHCVYNSPLLSEDEKDAYFVGMSRQVILEATGVLYLPLKGVANVIAGGAIGVGSVAWGINNPKMRALEAKSLGAGCINSL
ncbi:MAG: hypothetical protein FWD55_03185, partial [Propionibacteriaceae bacterium]|nr:hypothetical protein [Propionibacteriaceae bacterium]